MLDIALKLSLVVFMAGSLLEMGLGLGLAEAGQGLRDARFLGSAVLFGFVLGPALALLMVWALPLAAPHETGLMLLALTPCAPFLPMMVTRARGSMSRAAAMMLVAAAGAVVLLPLAAPALVEGLSVDAWTIAGPLIGVVVVPLAAGMALRHFAPAMAAAARPAVKRIAGIATILVLVLCAVIYGRDFASAVGTFAIGAQVLFLSILTAAAWLATPGLPPDRRSALALGMSTRNVGAAMAPLFAAPEADQGAVVMVVLGVPVQLAVSMLAARYFAGRTPAASADPGRGGQPTARRAP